MAETNIITQAVVAGLTDQLSQISSNLDYATAQITAQQSTLATNLIAHTSSTYSTAHGGINYIGSTYINNGGYTVGQAVELKIGGISYYVPSATSPTGMTYTPPPAPSGGGGDGGGGCM